MVMAEDCLPLTPREREVLMLVAQGLKNRAIAVRLNIARRTVEQHITSILQKAGVQDRTSAVVWALRVGIMTLE